MKWESLMRVLLDCWILCWTEHNSQREIVEEEQRRRRRRWCRQWARWARILALVLNTIWHRWFSVVLRRNYDETETQLNILLVRKEIEEIKMEKRWNWRWRRIEEKRQRSKKKITQLPHAEWKHSRESAKKQHIRSRKNGTVEATAPPSNIYNNFSYKDIARAIVSIFI